MTPNMWSALCAPYYRMVSYKCGIRYCRNTQILYCRMEVCNFWSQCSLHTWNLHSSNY